MFKEIIVDRVFDTILNVSSGIEKFFWFMAENDQDSIAWLTIATCSLLIVGCHDLLNGSGGIFRRTAPSLLPIVALLLAQLVLRHVGTSTTRLAGSRLEAKTGHAFRFSLDKDTREKASLWNHRIVRAPGVMSLEWAFLDSPGMSECESIKQVGKDGAGKFCLYKSGLWFSTTDGADPRTSAVRYYLVCEKPWRPQARNLAGVAFVLWGLGTILFRFAPPFLRFLAGLLRTRSFLIIGAASLLLLGGHQFRFLHQDHRMQMVTSRDDDGYMMERLLKAHDVKSMDPYAVSNRAYGAVGYYPLAALSYATGRLGLPLSLEALNLYVRGLKVLFSLAMLAAVWSLASRHFDNRSAVFATIMLLTNYGFLQYSSYPFYPDVMMSAAAIMAISFTLDLTRRWSDRSFFFAAFFAAFSVSIKFITFLLYPLLALVAVVAIWRETRGQWRSLFQMLAGRGLMAMALSVSVYFLCNPFMRYNIMSLVPDWKQFYGYYSVETPYLVAGAAATVRQWIATCYSSGSDLAESVLVVLVGLMLILLPIVLVVRKLARGGRSLGFDSFRAHAAWKALILIAYACVFQAYLFATVTLPESIDARLVLSTLPLLYIVAAYAVCLIWDRVTRRCAHEAGRPDEKPSAIRRLLPYALVIGIVFAMQPRISNAWAFIRNFGVVPPESSLRSFLDETGIPGDQAIIASIQSYIPLTFTRVIDGQWKPKILEELLFQSDRIPQFYIEDEYYRDSFFSDSIGKQGFNTPEQKAMHETGNAFYTRLRASRIIPFSLVHAGTEVIGTNDRAWASTQFRVYANQLAFSDNLIHRAKHENPEAGLPPNLGTRPRFSWAEPTTLSSIHLSTASVVESRKIQIRLTDAAQRTETLMAANSIAASGPAREHFVVLDPPRQVAALEIITEGTVPAFDRIHALAPAPVGLNPAPSFFDIKPGIHSPNHRTLALDGLLSRRKPEPCSVALKPKESVSFELLAKQRIVLSRLLLTFDAIDLKATTVHCTAEHDDGTSSDLTVTSLTTTNPSHFLLIFRSPTPRPVVRCKLTISNPSDSEITLTLRQIAPGVTLP